jgi:hypothetical protein
VDYSHALKVGSYKVLRDHMPGLLIAFSILRAPMYIDALLIQRSFYHYWELYKHPFHELATKSPSSLIGEDIELGNRLLSQHCSRDSRRSDPTLLSNAYVQLGTMMHNGMAMHDDIGNVMKSIKGSRRYEIKPEDLRVERAAAFFEKVLDEMEEDTWKHYYYKRKGSSKKKENKTKKKQVVVSDDDEESSSEDDSSDIEPEIRQYQSRNLDSRAQELKNVEIHPVPVLSEVNWMDYLQKKAATLYPRSEKWQVKVSNETIEMLKSGFPLYVHPRLRNKRKRE